MDLETLRFRAEVIQRIRAFFIARGYLELDTPALSPHLIPEPGLEAFRTEYIEPWSGRTRELYLVPSPEVHIKPLIARHKVSVFQLSKCYRNVESAGRIHSPEFTMLEYYTMDADYMDSARITEELLAHLLPPAPKDGSQDPFRHIRPPFMHLRMDDAFRQYAGFRLSDCPDAADIARHARRLGIMEAKDNPLGAWPWDDLYELVLVQCVEPSLPKDRPVLLTDYPAKVPCLAKDAGSPEGNAGGKALWKERWELYAGGMELSNCYSEETDPERIRAYFEAEGKAKRSAARVPHATDDGYWRHFLGFPRCSGNAMGVDRLVALLSGRTAIEGVLP